MGHGVAVSMKHYQQATEDNFARAAGIMGQSVGQTCQDTPRQAEKRGVSRPDGARHGEPKTSKKPYENRDKSNGSGGIRTPDRAIMSGQL